MTFAAALGSALWLGLLTAVSPCPLATNIAAISFIGRQVGRRSAVLASGLLYALGRAATYVVLGAMLAAGLLAAAESSRFLQRYMNEIIGPVLIVLGMVLLGWIGSGRSVNLAGAGVQARAARGGVIWAGMLGILFALSFCTVSAGLFFGGLIPLAVRQDSVLALPAAYGLGTALPVLVFAFLLAFSAEAVGRVFDRLTATERWVRAGAGGIFILAGLYLTLTRIYGLTFASP